MRITQLNQVNNLTKLAQSDAVPSELKALIGKIIDAKVVDVSNEGLKIDVDGMLLSVSYSESDTVQKGETLTLNIVDFQGNALIATKVVSTQVETKPFQDVLLKLGVEVNDDNVEIVKALIAQNLPITNETIKAMRLNNVQLRAFLNEWVSIKSDHPVLSPEFKLMEASIKDVLKSIVFSSDSVPYSIETQKEAASVVHPVQNQANILGVVAEVKKQENTIASNAETVVRTLLQESVTPKNEPLLPLKEAVTELINAFSLEYNAQIVKDQLGLNLKNLFLLYSQNTQIKTIGSGFVEIANAIKSMNLSQVEIHELLNALDMDDNEKALERFVDVIRSSTESSSLKDVIEKEMIFIKEAAQLSPNITDAIFYMPIPIRMNNENQNVDLYMKTKKRKYDIDDLSVLIALNTHHFGEVRCLVHKKKSAFSLNFSFDNESICARFESQQKQLLQSLNHMEHFDFDVHFSVKSKKAVLEFLMPKEVPSFSTMDIKV